MSNPRVKVKVKTGNLESAENMSNIFDQLTGKADSEPSIIIPKFVTIRNKCKYIYKTLKQFSTFKAFIDDFPEYKKPIEEIAAFADQLKEAIIFNENSDDTNEKYESVNKEQINILYRSLKDSQIIKRFIIHCSMLKRFHSDIIDITNLKDTFIAQEPGLSLRIFYFSTLDLKHLWANDRIQKHPMIKKYILTIINHYYKSLISIYEVITSPNVNIDEFAEIIITSINKLRYSPELSRCKNAFNRIAASVDMFKERFDTYYKDFLATNNPKIIIMSYITDLSNSVSSSASLAREFRAIIQYMQNTAQKISANQKNPELQKAMNMLNKSMGILEKKTGVDADADSITKQMEESKGGVADIADNMSTADIIKQLINNDNEPNGKPPTTP
jgi:hypothetical protein